MCIVCNYKAGIVCIVSNCKALQILTRCGFCPRLVGRPCNLHRHTTQQAWNGPLDLIYLRALDILFFNFSLLLLGSYVLYLSRGKIEAESASTQSEIFQTDVREFAASVFSIC